MFASESECGIRARITRRLVDAAKILVAENIVPGYNCPAVGCDVFCWMWLIEKTLAAGPCFILG